MESNTYPLSLLSAYRISPHVFLRRRLASGQDHGVHGSIPHSSRRKELSSPNADSCGCHRDRRRHVATAVPVPWAVPLRFPSGVAFGAPPRAPPPSRRHSPGHAPCSGFRRSPRLTSLARLHNPSRRTHARTNTTIDTTTSRHRIHASCGLREGRDGKHDKTPSIRQRLPAKTSRREPLVDCSA